MAIRVEMIGVVFHKGGAPLQINGDDLHGAEQRACFPVTLCAEAETVSHQALNREPGQLF